MSGYPIGDIRHPMPTEMKSTGMSRYPASIEIRSAGTFRYLAGRCGYSMPTGIQSAPMRRPVETVGAWHAAEAAGRQQGDFTHAIPT
jgi:hypothetical protein